jgi:NADH:ubiquinone oxidoreductase subunit K
LWGILKFKIVADKQIELQISSAIVFSLLFGFITLLILGQTFKNLAFIVWLKKYQEISGKVKTPLPKDLYSEKIATLQLYLFIISFIIVLYGILMSNSVIIKLGAISLIITAILYTINVFKIIFHKDNSTPLV